MVKRQQDRSRLAYLLTTLTATTTTTTNGKRMSKIRCNMASQYPRLIEKLSGPTFLYKKISLWLHYPSKVKVTKSRWTSRTPRQGYFLETKCSLPFSLCVEITEQKPCPLAVMKLLQSSHMPVPHSPQLLIVNFVILLGLTKTYNPHRLNCQRLRKYKGYKKNTILWKLQT